MGLAREFGSLGHLVRRFFGALWPAGPAAEDEAWALERLLPGERALWRRMSGPDRRHAVGVARDALALLSAGGERPGREVAASALLHDVGKVEAGLGTFGRVAATVAAVLVGRDRLTALAEGRGGRGPLGKVARYLGHDRIGARLLQAAGSHSLTIAWAEEHHREPARWSVERRVGEALKAADGD